MEGDDRPSSSLEENGTQEIQPTTSLQPPTDHHESSPAPVMDLLDLGGTAADVPVSTSLPAATASSGADPFDVFAAPTPSIGEATSQPPNNDLFLLNQQQQEPTPLTTVVDAPDDSTTTALMDHTSPISGLGIDVNPTIETAEPPTTTDEPTTTTAATDESKVSNETQQDDASKRIVTESPVEPPLPDQAQPALPTLQQQPLSSTHTDATKVSNTTQQDNNSKQIASDPETSVDPPSQEKPVLPKQPISSTTTTEELSSTQLASVDAAEFERTKVINAELERQIKTLREQLKTVQQQFDRQLSARAQAEQSSTESHATIRQLQTDLERTQEYLTTAQTQTASARQQQAKVEHDLEQLRIEYDEHQQAKMSLEVRLNESRKVEAAEANLVEHYEEDLKAAYDDLEATREELEQLKRDHQHALQQWKFAEQRVEETKAHFEGLLEDEKKRNEQRKAKMKTFVEKKTEELRQSKEDCDNLQNEIAQTNQSLLDMDKRWKQLHAQWAQTQTRNRELQRDLNRIKKDSENLHKQGDTLEMKLSRSANETEEHKNKRLAAKHELMSVLRTLDAERDSAFRLCQRVKFTVAPRVLQQQQMLDESRTELDGALHRLALRSGKPMPTGQSDSVHESGERIRENGSSDSAPMHVEGTANNELLSAIEKLDEETKRVSRVTEAVSEQIERLRGLVDSSGERSCITVLSELVSTGSIASSPAALQNHAHTISSVLPAIRGRPQGYGQVPRASENA